MRALPLALLLAALAPLSARAAARHITPHRVAVRVGALFGDRHPRIIHLQRTVTEGSEQPMYVIEITGRFHQRRRHARYLYFSALEKRWHVWGVVAYNAHHHIVWTDPSIRH